MKILKLMIQKENQRKIPVFSQNQTKVLVRECSRPQANPFLLAWHSGMSAGCGHKNSHQSHLISYASTRGRIGSSNNQGYFVRALSPRKSDKN